MLGIKIPKNIDPERILSVKDLAEQTGLVERTLRDWMFRGVLKRTKIGPHMVGIRWKHFLEIVKEMPR